jgi:hypothetical protein
MPVEAVRFLHASDFRLDCPLGGITEVPGHLRESFVEAPYRAATRVFDAAIHEEVDFVVLSGGLLDPYASGPRGVLFLQEQFQRLADRGTQVYWAGSACDGTDDWPHELSLPENVHHFPTGHVSEVLHRRDGQVIARLIGQSRGRRQRFAASEYCREATSVLTIAVAHGAIDFEDVSSRGMPDYWALGGESQSRSFEHRGAIVQYPGSPQGRDPEEPGPHGCVLVAVDNEGSFQTRLVATDVLRWLTMRLRLDPHIPREAFERLLGDASKALLSKESGANLLVSWNIDGSGPLWQQLHRGRLADEWLARLRGDLGYASPSLWSLAFDIVPPALESDAALEEDSLLGDYLRTLRTSEIDGETMDLSSFLPEWAERAMLGTMAEIAPAERDDLVRRAALLGRELLRGEVQPS